MPFGLVNAPSTFQRAMSVALQGCEEFAVVYIDDILVFSSSRDQHLQHLRKVFAALQGQSYHVRLSKCSFFASEVPFLGHILTPDGIKAADKRFDHIQSFPTPFSNPKQVRSFLGMVMWYRTFIPHISTLAAPLFPLTSVKKGFTWTPEAEQSVTALKYALTRTPVLSRYDHDRETRVTTDASTIGIGAVLEQLHDHVWKPIAFWSRKLLDAETRYSATDLEWLAVVEAVSRVWRHLLEDIPFTVRSDHAALARKLSKSAHDPPISPRQARWIERLMPYSITFEYIPGSQNVVPDALSRYPALSTNACLTLVAPHLVGLVSRIAVAAKQDPDYMALVNKLQRRLDEPPTDPEATTGEVCTPVDIATSSSQNGEISTNLGLANLLEDGDKLQLHDGVIFSSEGQILLPKEDELRTLVISEAHDSPLGGHFGQAKTLEKVRRLWQWRGLANDVKEYVASCPLCQHMKHSTVKPRGLLKPILAEKPWQIVTLDLVGKFAPAENTQNTHCLVMVDKFSKFVILEAVPETLTAAHTAEIFLRRVVSVFGVPSVVISDRGTQFSAKLWKQLLEKIGSAAALASSHHPQTDGQSERAIQTFLRLLRSYTFEMNEQWEAMLPLFQYALNDSAVEPNGISPHRLVFGHNPTSPLQSLVSPDAVNSDGRTIVIDQQWVIDKTASIEKLWAFVRNNQLRCAERMKDRYDQHRQDLELSPGDLVLVSAKTHPLLRQYRKQAEKWYGPYVVKKKVSDNAYAIADLPAGTPETQHSGFLSKYKASPSRFPNRPPLSVNVPELKDGEWEWEVERIEDMKVDRRGVTKFLVYWIGYPKPEWKTLEELKHCKEVLKDYFDRIGEEIPPNVQSFLDEDS